MNDKDESEKTQSKKKGRLNIKVNDDVARGKYANLALVHNNESEFVFDFVFVEPQRPQGQVVSRVVTNPRTAKRMLAGINELMRRYEEILNSQRSTPSFAPQTN